MRAFLLLLLIPSFAYALPLNYIEARDGEFTEDPTVSLTLGAGINRVAGTVSVGDVDKVLLIMPPRLLLMSTMLRIDTVANFIARIYVLPALTSTTIIVTDTLAVPLPMVDQLLQPMYLLAFTSDTTVNYQLNLDVADLDFGHGDGTVPEPDTLVLLLTALATLLFAVPLLRQSSKIVG
jgi:hypothetical protein